MSNVGGDVAVSVEERRLISEHIWKLLELKESTLRLKLGQTLREGDLNTRFFHNSLKIRQQRNFISNIKTTDSLVESVKEVKLNIRKHFLNFFKEPCRLRPVPEEMSFKRLDDGVADFLERPFTKAEVKQAIWDCEGSKMPGPDRYTLDFFKVF